MSRTLEMMARWLRDVGLEWDPSTGVMPSFASIRAAYRKQALRYHPDKNGSESAVVMFKRATDAFDRLKVVLEGHSPSQQSAQQADDDLPGALHDDWTAFDHGLYDAVWNEDVARARDMIAQGGRPDQYRNNIWGGTALMLASQLGHQELARLLLKHGASVTTTDLHGKTALDWARRRHAGALFESLLRQAMNTDTKRRARSSL